MMVVDKFPKSRRHVLLLPNQIIIEPRDLTLQELPLLRQMRDYAYHLQELEGPKLIGFHAFPSMHQLHLHVLDQDLQNVKRRETWNSFTTPFLLSIDWVISELETHGRLDLDEETYQEYVKGPIRCYLCQLVCSNIPKAQQHLQTHLQTHLNPQAVETNE